jgi:DNA polymerase-3 subunit gamma/tau
LPERADPPGRRDGSRLADAQDWQHLVDSLQLTAMAGELARHGAFVGWDGRRLKLALEPDLLHLRAAGAEERLRTALSAALGCDLRLEISPGTPAADTPARQQAKATEARLAAAERKLAQDPIVHRLCGHFEADWVPGSIQATD